MSINYDGQVVIVTGGGQGLGRQYALELGRRRAMVVVNDLAGMGNPDGSAAETVAGEIRSAGGDAVASHDSVATPEGGKAIVDLALERFGTVDAVIHNAGVWRHELYEDMTADQLDPVLDVHLRGAFFVTQPAWRIMKEKGYGRIVLTSSSTGAFGRIRGTNYAAAKSGLLGLSKTVARELGAKNITCNVVAPGFIETDMTASLPAEVIDRVKGAQAVRSVGQPGDIAAAVAYLTADDAGFITGQTICVDGGMTMC